MGCRISFVGLTGLAGSGKDLFFSLSKDILKKKRKAACRVSLADQLKEQTKSTLKDMFNVDPTNCSREEKDRIRDFLVFYGAMKRKETRGRYWIKKAEKTIKTDASGRALRTQQILNFNSKNLCPTKIYISPQKIGYADKCRQMS